jgi:hypothetical protein
MKKTSKLTIDRKAILAIRVNYNRAQPAYVDRRRREQAAKMKSKGEVASAVEREVKAEDG